MKSEAIGRRGLLRLTFRDLSSNFGEFGSSVLVDWSMLFNRGESFSVPALLIIIIGSTLPEAERERFDTGVVPPVVVVVVGVDERELVPLRGSVGVANCLLFSVFASKDFDLVQVVFVCRFSIS